MNKHLVKILPALLTSLADSYGTSDQEKELEYSQTVILSVTDEIGVSHVLDILLDSCRSPDPITRRGAVTLLHGFCEQTKVDYTEYVPQLIRSKYNIFISNRGIKTYRTNKTKLPLQFCSNCITIIIGQ